MRTVGLHARFHESDGGVTSGRSSLPSADKPFGPGVSV